MDTPRLGLGLRVHGALSRLTIRSALLLGFTLVFALWLASSLYLTGRLGEIETLSAATYARQEQGQELLLTVRAQVLLGSIYVRDALEEKDPDTLLFYRRELQNVRADVERALQQYLPDVDSPTEREHWSRLQAELADYWNTMLPVLAWEPAPTTATSEAFLPTQVVPKHEVILEISERIRALKEDAFRQQQQRLDLLSRSARRRAWEMSSFAVVLGLGIAVVATRYAGRLESRIRQQHAEVVENRRDLRRLSAKVVHAQEEERRRIARELHDEIGQALTAMKTELTLTEHHGGLSGKAAQSLAQARSITERTIETVRNLSELLHPATLDDFGLPDTLASYLKSFSERTGVRTELVQDRMAPRMPAELEVSAYRIVQEALTNIAKHAEATTCRVFVQHLPYSLLLTVEDDGKGFDPKRSAAGGDRGGLGLVGIRERASELGGTFRLEGSPGKGTRVTVELPIPSGVQEGAASQDLVSGVLPEER